MSLRRALQASFRWPTIVAFCGRSVMRHLGRRRVPVLQQLNDFECGAACLAMILGYHGRSTRVAECREACGVGRDGVSAQGIARAARSFGLRVRALCLDCPELRELPLPAIVHWKFDHFIVVERWSPAKIDIVDPAIGRRRLSSDEFDAGFTGVVLTLEPGVYFEAARSENRKLWWSYVSGILHAPGTPGLLVQILVSSFVVVALGLVLPIFTEIIVDRVLPCGASGLLPIFGAGLVTVVVAQLIGTYLRAALLIHLQARLDMQITLGFFEHLLSLPLRFFQQRNSGDLLMRLGSNAAIREALTSQTLSALLDGVFVAAYVALLLARAPLFALLACAAGSLQAAVLLGTSRRLQDLTQRDLAAQSASQSYLVEVLGGMALLKACGTEGHALEYWSSLFSNELNVSLRRGHLSAALDTALTSLRTLSPLLVLWVGATRVLNGSMSLGTMLALIGLVTAFLGPLASLISNGQRFHLVAAHLERIADVLETRPEQDVGVLHDAPPLTGLIELKNVGFRYHANAPFVFRNVSVTIKPGQKVSLVGRTGSGKSTLAMLLLGLYEPTEGEILFDGVPISKMDYRSLRGQFGVVLQESFLFTGSIRQNITFHSPCIRLEGVVKAARMAAIDEEIEAMPMGYETRISDGGGGLSGGQRQRLSLARALANDPAVLLLDEATSHLDAVTEQIIEENLSTLCCTRIVITHRLSTACNSDQILVLEGGTVAEAARLENSDWANSMVAATRASCSRTALDE